MRSDTERERKVRILNVEVDNLPLKSLLAALGSSGGVVYTPNVDHLVKLRYDGDLFRAYQAADYLTCDSQILMFAAKLLNAPICEKISGSDLLPSLYRYYASDPNVTLFLLGAAEGVAARARDYINTKVQRQMVTDVYSPPYGFERDEVECEAIIDRVNRSGATVLAVGLGAPKQEKWIYQYRHRMPAVKTILAIGASIDFEAGNVPRAPAWMSRWGLEWAFRLGCEPKRLWRRYLVESVPFFFEIIRQKFGRYVYQAPAGEIFVLLGLISTEELDQILAIQQQAPLLRFGEVAVVKQWIARTTVEFFATQLTDLPQRSEATVLSIAAEAALLSTEQRQELDQESARQNRPPEDIAIERGWLKAVTVSFLQRALIEGYPAGPIGFTLQQAGLLTVGQVQAIRDIQRNPAQLQIGDWLVLKGWASPEVVEFVRTEVPKRLGRLSISESIEHYINTVLRDEIR